MPFEWRRNTNYEFDQAIEQIQKKRTSNNTAVYEALRQQANSVCMSSQKTRRLRSIQGAAIVVVLLISAGIWWKSSNTSNVDSLYATYYETPTPSTPRTATGHELETWMQAIQAFSEQNYVLALNKFSELSEIDQFISKSEVQFYSGISQMELENYDGAIKTFRSISSKSKYSLDTKWYLSLAYLKSNKLDLAKELLTEIRDVSGYKAAEAEMILLNI